MKKYNTFKLWHKRQQYTFVLDLLIISALFSVIWIFAPFSTAFKTAGIIWAVGDLIRLIAMGFLAHSANKGDPRARSICEWIMSTGAMSHRGGRY